METVPKYVFLGFLTLVVGALIAISVFTTRSAPEPAIHGVGSTFVNPLLVQWSNRYETTEGGGRVAYLGMGSGAGIKKIIDGRTDFACSDAPLTDEQMEQARAKGGEVVHIPLVMGAVVPIHNVPGLKEPLKLTGPLLADIFLGKVKRWDDPALKGINPGAELPAKEIHVIHRSDGSGTTHIWADYLSKSSPEWKERVGVGTSLKWPVGTGEDGNEAVALKVKDTPLSIGYAELTYAYRFDLPFALVRNKEGEYVRASLAAVTTAADNALKTIPDDLRYSMTDAPGKGSYPIAGTTWAIVRIGKHPKAKQVADFLRWAVDEGQDRIGNLFYSRLPEKLAERARAGIARIDR